MDKITIKRVCSACDTPLILTIEHFNENEFFTKCTNQSCNFEISGEVFNKDKEEFAFNQGIEFAKQGKSKSDWFGWSIGAFDLEHVKVSFMKGFDSF